MIPTEARIELYDLQADCGRRNVSYIDAIWELREPYRPRSTGAWPFRRVAEQRSNVTQFPLRLEMPGDGWMA